MVKGGTQYIVVDTNEVSFSALASNALASEKFLISRCVAVLGNTQHKILIFSINGALFLLFRFHVFNSIINWAVENDLAFVEYDTSFAKLLNLACVVADHEHGFSLFL